MKYEVKSWPLQVRVRRVSEELKIQSGINELENEK